MRRNTEEVNERKERWIRIRERERESVLIDRKFSRCKNLAEIK